MASLIHFKLKSAKAFDSVNFPGMVKSRPNFPKFRPPLFKNGGQDSEQFACRNLPRIKYITVQLCARLYVFLPTWVMLKISNKTRDV